AAHALVREAGEAPAEGKHGAKGFAIDNLRVEYRCAELGELRLNEPLRLWAERRPGLREYDSVGNRPARDPLLHLDHADLLGRQLGVELRSLDRDHDELRLLDGVSDDEIFGAFEVHDNEPALCAGVVDPVDQL